MPHAYRNEASGIAVVILNAGALDDPKAYGPS